MALDLIYCAGNNRALTRIAVEEGYLVGMRSDNILHKEFKPSMIDVDYRRPDWNKHLATVAKHRPKFAVVPDLSDKEVSRADIDRAIARARELEQYCEIALVVPKLPGQIDLLPQDIAIGYSIPTSNGGATYPFWELEGRRVHLLGGSPHDQLRYYRYISPLATVISADGNMSQKMALQFMKFWQAGKWVRQAGEMPGEEKRLECWRQSCRNIRAMWDRER